MRVLLVCEPSLGAETVRAGLERTGCSVAACVSAPTGLVQLVNSCAPDVIVVHIVSPTPALLAEVGLLSRTKPRPVVIFADDGDPELVREAVNAGVASYVVNGLRAERVQSVLDVALARFEQSQRLQAELADATAKLSERKLVDRAKGILMKSRGFSEDEAYKALRRMAMDRGKRLGEVAQQVIDVASVLG
jgi:two-component system, response regulator / RNA-binding antiterminator